RLNGIYDDLLNGAGVQHVPGHGTILDPHTVEVAGKTYTTENILLATGSWPNLPDVPGIEHAISSNEVFFLEQQPRRVLIVGGGYIAVEFAGIFNGMGSEVVQVYRGPLFLRGFDNDVRAHLAGEMRKHGVDLRFDLNVSEIEKVAGGLRASLTDGSQLEVDQILYATGRAPLTENIGLENAGVELNAKGAIAVDEYSRTSVPNIYAIGDVTDRINLTPVALHEGMCLADTLFNDKPTMPVHRDVPAAVFSQPPIGTVGLSEAQARDEYAEIDVYESTFRALKHTLTKGEELTYMKLVVDRKSDRVLGVMMVGPDAGDIVQGFAVALKCDATKAQFDSTIGVVWGERGFRRMAHCCRGVFCGSLRLGVEGLRGCWEGGSALFRRKPLSPQTLPGTTLDWGWLP
ncbi:MAG: FAD-dependent oxidoreductase, partial [Deltaproteobacteria bacterium]|nr:FAD-dependent oxidoreductase [Deltaproteobacteria bacterium]